MAEELENEIPNTIAEKLMKTLTLPTDADYPVMHRVLQLLNGTTQLVSTGSFDNKRYPFPNINYTLKRISI